MVRICASILTSADVTTECVSGCWMIGAEDVGQSFRSSEKLSYGNPPRWHVCRKVFSKVSGKASELNKIRLLASAISPADTIPQ